MDVTPESLYHNRTGELKHFFCYRNGEITSAGLYQKDNPLEFSFPLLLYEITVIFIATRFVHAILRRFSLPLVISQIIAGMLLGPTFLGRHKKFESLFFKPEGWETLNTLSYVSFALFVFIIGVKTDIGMIPKSGKKAIAVAFMSTGMSHLFIGIFVRINEEKLPIFFDNTTFNIFLLGMRWSMTSYVVLACALGELNLLTSKLGRLAMSAALLADFFNTFASAFLTMILFGRTADVKTLLYSLASFIGFLVVLVFVARVFVVWLIHQAPHSRFLDEARLVTILVIALICALATEVAGYHTWGAFIFGLILPGGAPLGITMVERLDRLVTGIFVPVFVALAGLRMDLGAIWVNMIRWKFLQTFLSLSVLGKFLGTVFTCLFFRLQLKDALVLGLMMNFRGIREVDYTVQFQDNSTLDSQQYTILMSNIILLGGITAVLVKFFYRPEDCFITYKKRTIHHSMPGDELRVLICIHSQSDVAPTLSILDACYPTPSSPLCVYLIHLVELAGRSDTVLRPYKHSTGRPRKINSTASNSDRIVNAFQTYETQRSSGAISILPYVCVSPYNTMHADVCSVALDKKAVLVLIPFHVRYNTDGSAEPPNHSILTLNQNVLSYAPCSVAILIDRTGGSTVGFNHQIAMYFIGGPDDREALALAARMADNPAVSLTVMRFRESHERRLRSNQALKENDSERLDNEILNDFILESVDDERIIYREEEINSGEEMVGVIRETNGMFSLLIVGRRGDVKDHANDSLMAGLTEWSEHPELGVIGDLLVSPDFGCMVPTLVVQQQAMGKYDSQFGDKVVSLEEDANL